MVRTLRQVLCKQTFKYTLLKTLAMNSIKQLFVSLPYPTSTFAGKTVIITGSNTGLGKEAACHIARLGAETLILAVRSVEKGNAAKHDIENSTKCGKDVIQVWHLDMASYSSVLEFVDKATKLPRIDALIANASIATMNYAVAEDNESTLTVNVISTFLLVLAMLPKMKETAENLGITPVISIISSGSHAGAKFPERLAPEGKILATLNSDRKIDAFERYPTTKLLQTLYVKHIGEQYPKLGVTVNDVNPGFCHSELSREATGMMSWIFWFSKLLFARTTEYGSRTLVHAASQGSKTHGACLGNCAIAARGGIAAAADVKEVQERVWKEIIGKLESIKPGISKGLDM